LTGLNSSYVMRFLLRRGTTLQRTYALSVHTENGFDEIVIGALESSPVIKSPSWERMVGIDTGIF
jgi:hypothetical protein